VSSPQYQHLSSLRPVPCSWTQARFYSMIYATRVMAHFADRGGSNPRKAAVCAVTYAQRPGPGSAMRWGLCFRLISLIRVLALKAARVVDGWTKKRIKRLGEWPSSAAVKRCRACSRASGTCHHCDVWRGRRLGGFCPAGQRVCRPAWLATGGNKTPFRTSRVNCGRDSHSRRCHVDPRHAYSVLATSSSEGTSRNALSITLMRRFARVSST